MTEQLIEMVKTNAFLYDSSHKNYKNASLKDEIWKKIGTEMNENGMYINLIFY